MTRDAGGGKTNRSDRHAGTRVMKNGRTEELPARP